MNKFLSALKLAAVTVTSVVIVSCAYSEPQSAQPDVPPEIADRLTQFLNMDLYVYETKWTAPPEEMQKFAKAHLDYQVKLEDDGVLFAAGPIFEEGDPRFPPQGGLIIIRAESFDAARAIADADPMHANDLREYTLRRWTVNEGSLSVTIKFSGQRAVIE